MLCAVRCVRVTAILVLSLLALADREGRAAGARIRVPGTGVSLEAPAAFDLSSRWQGFESEDGLSSIQIEEYDEPVLAFQQRVTNRDLLKRGIMWVDSQKVDVGGQDAAMVHVKEYAGDRLQDAWMLVLGDDSHTVMVKGSIPAGSPSDVAEAMHRALLSVQWNPDASAGIFDGLHFRIEEPEGLRIVRRTANAVVLAAPGTAGPADPRLAVSSSLAAAGSADLEVLARANLDASARIKADPKSLQGRSLVVSDMRGYELTARGEEEASHTPLALYQAIFRRGDRLFVLEGAVAADRSAVLEQFRAVASSLRPTD
jgi:hypothetical protein